MICVPRGERGNGAATSDGQVTEGVTAGLQEPPPSQRERTDPPPQAQPTEPVRQWWRTPPLVTKQRPAQAGRGQKCSAQHGRQGQVQGVKQHPQQGQMPTARQGEPGSLVTQAEQTEQQRERSGQPLPRQGEPRVRGEESFQRLLSRASEPAVEGAPSPWSPFRAPPEAWRPQPTRRQRALATAQVLRQSPSREQGSRGARRETVSGTGGGPENGYQVVPRRALNTVEETNDEDERDDPSYREEALPESENEETEGEGMAREGPRRREERGEWEQLYQDAADAVNAPPPPRQQPDAAGVLSRAEGLAKRGSPRRAVLALESTPVCTPSPEILEELRLKHLPAESEVTWPTPQGSTLSIPHADFAKMLGGAETVIHAARAYLDVHPTSMVLQADIANAFNSVSRHAIATVLQDPALSPLLPFVKLTYGNLSQLLLDVNFNSEPLTVPVGIAAGDGKTITTPGESRSPGRVTAAHPLYLEAGGISHQDDAATITSARYLEPVGDGFAYDATDRLWHPRSYPPRRAISRLGASFPAAVARGNRHYRPLNQRGVRLHRELHTGRAFSGITGVCPLWRAYAGPGSHAAACRRHHSPSRVAH
ncbi:unnamed protein product [Closterium sp. NIES-54]